MFTVSKLDFISAPLINSAIYLSECGYKVDIFALASDKFPVPRFASGDITYVPYRLPHPNAPGTTFIATPCRLNMLLGRKRYSFFVGFDPGGLVNAAVLGILRRTPYIYHSLEIVSESTLTNWRRKLDKQIERWLSRGAVLTITQDELRADVLARENRLDRSQVAVVYNAPLGEPFPARSSWLRDRFGIPETKYIVLGVGSLIERHMVDEIAASVKSWPDQFVLVLHGWFSDEAFEKRVYQIAEGQPNRIFVSTTLLPYEHKYLVFQSADVGVVFYKPVDDNHRYVGAAAGKLFDFMRCGVPVVVIDLPGMRELVEGNWCGVVVADSSGIAQALSKIHHHYQEYRDQSLSAYRRYDFAQSYAKALMRIESSLRVELCHGRGKR